MIKYHVNVTYYYLTLEIRTQMVHFYSKGVIPPPPVDVES